MTDTTVSSSEFNLDMGGAKEAALFITDRSRPAHVLPTMHEHQRLTGGPMTLIEALVQPDAAEVDFDPPRVKVFYRSADLF
jgi:hypothetical protein